MKEGGKVRPDREGEKVKTVKKESSWIWEARHCCRAAMRAFRHKYGDVGIVLEKIQPHNFLPGIPTHMEIAVSMHHGLSGRVRLAETFKPLCLSRLMALSINSWPRLTPDFATPLARLFCIIWL